jgi:hypothetical protein
MEKIQIDDKLIASAHGPDVAVSGLAPGRPRQRLAAMLLGLIAISLGATADMAYGEKAGSHSGCKTAADLGGDRSFALPLGEGGPVMWGERE